MKIEIILQPAINATAIYIAGNFNGWNPRDENFRLQKDDEGKWVLQLPNSFSGNGEFINKCII